MTAIELTTKANHAGLNRASFNAEYAISD